MKLGKETKFGTQKSINNGDSKDNDTACEAASAVKPDAPSDAQTLTSPTKKRKPDSKDNEGASKKRILQVPRVTRRSADTLSQVSNSGKSEMAAPETSSVHLGKGQCSSREASPEKALDSSSKLQKVQSISAFRKYTPKEVTPTKDGEDPMTVEPSSAGTISGSKLKAMSSSVGSTALPKRKSDQTEGDVSSKRPRHDPDQTEVEDEGIVVKLYFNLCYCLFPFQTYIFV